MAKQDIVARFAVGAEACEDGIGTIIVERCPIKDFYRVYINGGVLPDGRDEWTSVGLVTALQYAIEVVQLLMEELDG